MEKGNSINSILFASLLTLVVLAAESHARSSPRRTRGGLYGDWEVKVNFDGREFTSILYFSRDARGNRTGKWISFWGVTELKNLKFEDGKLTFEQEIPRRQGQSYTAKFTGNLEDGKLSGTLSSDRGQYKVEGKPARRIPRAVGTWEVKFRIGDREITSRLIIKADKQGKLSAEWPSERIENRISEVKYERGRLTFKRSSKMQDRQWESTFEGNIDYRTDKLTGTIKSERGEIAVEGTRVGAPLIGTWDLDVASEMGTVKQRLKVNRDLSALYGSIPVKQVKLDGDKVTFNVVLEFGERKFEMAFEGKLQDAKLTGELKTSRGTAKVTGKKVVRVFRRPGTSATR